MRAGTEAAFEAALHAELHGMVDGGRSVGVDPDHAGAWIEPRTAQNRKSASSRVVYADRNRRTQRSWIAVNGLEESGALRAHVADPEYRVWIQLALDFE